MKKSLIWTAVVAAFAAMLVYGTLASQSHQCTVHMDFRGRTNSATASAASRDEAINQARTTACGPITQGMDETIACGNTPPVKSDCTET